MPSYRRINAQGVAEVVHMTPDAQEKAWAKVVSEGSTDLSPILKYLRGGEGSGKPFIVKSDHKKIRGDTVVITKVGAPRGRGRHGDQDRVGHEKHLAIASFEVRIGHWWDGYSVKNTAKGVTLIGSEWDKRASDFLQRNYMWKQVDDMLKELHRCAQPRNTIRPNHKGSRDALRSGDVFSTNTVTEGSTLMSTLACTPASLATDANGNTIRSYLFMGNQFSLQSYLTSQSYLDGLRSAEVRGANNPLWTGHIKEWAGHPVFQWELEDPSLPAPAGCQMLSRAFLAATIPASTSSVSVYGGGAALEVQADGTKNDTDVGYFQNFSNAPYDFASGITISADITTTRYAAAYNLTGTNAGKIFYFSYKINDGNKLVIHERLGSANSDAQRTQLTGSSITWGTGAGAGTLGGVGLCNSADAGALIVEVNSAGVPFGFMYVLGQGAGYFAYGALEGKNHTHGGRTVEEGNHNLDKAIGFETVFGVRADQRMDKIPGNYALIECAIPLAGFPVIVD